MYIEKIRINKFRVLEDIEVRFQVPDLTAVDEGRGNGNVVNVIAGVNGTGKSSLLEAIYQLGNNNLTDNISAICKEQEQNGSRIIFTSAHMPVQFSTNYMQQVRQGSSSVSQKLKVKGVSERINYHSLLNELEEWIKIYIVEQERQVFDADPKKRTAVAVNNFNEIFDGLLLETKLYGLDEVINRSRPLFRNISGDLVSIGQLSDGETQVYSRILRLLSENLQNSIVLIDEPEIALHPAWQQKIMQIYSRIGTNNQFIVATHSPQVIASVPYQNRILLRKEGGKIEPVHCHQPPSGVDVNSILAEVMGADPRPREVVERYQRYRQLVEEKQENSEEAKKLRELLVNDEGEHSRFMQEMAFFIELRDAA